MSKLAVTDFSKRTGSPFQSRSSPESDDPAVIHEEVLQKTYYEKQKEKQSELIQKVNKKTAEIQSNKPVSTDGCFTEVVTHGAFTSKSSNENNKSNSKPISTRNSVNGSNGSKYVLGFPSSANDLALDAKSDLESDPNMCPEVKEKVIEKLFALVSMVQHTYESKVRVMTEFEKFKDTHLKNEVRREREHSEQLYKLNMNFQADVVLAIQQLKSELDISRNVANVDANTVKDCSIEFNISENGQHTGKSDIKIEKDCES